MIEDQHLPGDPTRTEDEGVTLDLPEGVRGFTSGQVLGERYQIRSLLGRGGMGEVWHAFDLKLRVEVALKALREDLFKSERRRELLRQEVRAAREVVSPNVCRIFDLIEIEGRELVSMEYVDGATLLAVLLERGPLELKEAQDIASQFLAGLEAIHKAGLIHRDIKPENIMLTRAGRVVVMDFGLARQETEGGGTVSGTPAYMAPEQATGQTLDARADVYAAGVVLAEMVCPEGIKSIQSRQSVWEGVRSEPAKVPDTPWAAVIRKAVVKDREGRYNSAHTLTRALEDVTLRVEGAEDLHPYPGLASFTENDAEYFFGREAEVEQMWRKLEGPARMLALVGPSGAGKTSFLRAGLIPAATSGWATTICTPGTNPVLGLSRALAASLAGDREAVDLLLRFDDQETAIEVVTRWRQRAGQAVLIVDQFEELFTQNGVEVQQRFTELLERLVLEADVHVLLSMRDDFLIRCREHDGLAPLFADLTALLAPIGTPLRRALTQPALQCGYRFEDDELVDEMLAEVEGERGALPLLAFAAARLWEKRDRNTGLLTRTAFHDIGGVGGALARHAEATVDRIGHEHLPIVRELFRNLVTAEGTRAVREWNELLSVFCDSSDESQAVLRSLIDARLLTSYEVREEDREPTRRIEIIHESLLANWPRLVRWQTQDADAAQLRDHLRQAAKTWDEHGRTDDMLWTGSAYREFAVWRERYPGGLTELEEAFTSAMTSLANRRKRRRRIATTAALTLALVIAAVFGTLWRRSVLETRRAEAAKLLALAQAQLETDPTEALAFTTASLDLADTQEARIFAIRALGTGTPVVALDLEAWSGGYGFMLPAFSPDGRWLAVGGLGNGKVLVWNEHGGSPIVLDGHATSASGPIQCAWTRDGILATGHWTEGRARLWSVPDGLLIQTIDFGRPTWWMIGEHHLLAELRPPPLFGVQKRFELGRWELPNGGFEDLGTIDLERMGASQTRFDPSGQRWLYSKGSRVLCRVVPTASDAPDQLVERHSRDDIDFGYWWRADPVYSIDSASDIVLWNAIEGRPATGQRLRHPDKATTRLRPDSTGRWMVEDSLSEVGRVALWDLTNLSSANPWLLRRRGAWSLSQTDVDPEGRWIVATTDNQTEVSFWPLPLKLPVVVDGWMSYGFSPDGHWIVTSDFDVTTLRASRVRLWPMPGGGAADFIEVRVPDDSHSGNWVAVDPTNRFVLSTWYGDSNYLLPTDGSPPRKLEGFPIKDQTVGDFSPSGNRLAVASQMSDDEPTLRIWDLKTGEETVFVQPRDHEALQGQFITAVRFVDDNTLLSCGSNGLVQWNVETGARETILRAPPGGTLDMQPTSGMRKVLISELDTSSRPRRTGVFLHDLATGDVQDLDIPGDGLAILSPDGSIWATANQDGSLLVGQTTGGEPHLLLGPPGRYFFGSMSSDKKWIVLGCMGSTVLWPIPDLSKPPLHTLPHDELIAKLKNLTNLRAVRDPESSTGWKIEVGPFPGWADVQEW